MENTTTQLVPVEPATPDSAFTQETINGQQVRFRKRDSFGSLTDLLKIHGKIPGDYLRLPQAKAFQKALAADLGVLRDLLITTHHNGLHRGTWAHPLLCIHAAQWADLGFGIACQRLILKVSSERGRTLGNGDVTLPLNAQAMDDAVAARSVTLTPEQFDRLNEMVAAMDRRLKFLEVHRERHLNAIKGVLKIAVDGHKTASALYDQLEASMGVLALPNAAPATPAPAPIPAEADPNVYDVTRPSLRRMRELISERVRAVARRENETFYGRVWGRFYDLFLERTGVNVRTRNRRVAGRKLKSGSKLHYIECLGLLPAAFDLSLEFIA